MLLLLFLMIKILWELAELLRSWSFQNQFPKTWIKMFWLSLHLFVILSFLIWKSNKLMSFETRAAAWCMWTRIKDFSAEWLRKLPVCVCAEVVTALLTKTPSLEQGSLEQWARAPQFALKSEQMLVGGFNLQSQRGQSSSHEFLMFLFSFTDFSKGQKEGEEVNSTKTKMCKLFFFPLFSGKHFVYYFP